MILAYAGGDIPPVTFHAAGVGRVVSLAITGANVARIFVHGFFTTDRRPAWRHRPIKQRDAAHIRRPMGDFAGVERVIFAFGTKPVLRGTNFVLPAVAIFNVWQENEYRFLKKKK